MVRRGVAGLVNLIGDGEGGRYPGYGNVWGMIFHEGFDTIENLHVIKEGS